MIRAVSLSADHVLGDMPDPTQALADASGKPRILAESALRRRLYGASVAAPAFDDIACDLGLDADTVERIIRHDTPFQADDDAVHELDRLAARFPHITFVVTINVPVTAGADITTIRSRFQHAVGEFYFSCETRWVKGIHFQAFTQIAADLGIRADEVLHIGAHRFDDVHAPLLAGCRALWINPRHQELEFTLAGPDRYRSAPDRHTAIQQLRAWLDADTAR